MSKLIVKTSSTNEHSDGCEYAIIDLTQEFAQAILNLRDTFLAILAVDNHLDEVVFSNCNAEYFSERDIPEELEEFFDVFDNHVSAPADFEPEIERTECDRMVICRDGVIFRCYPKHCDWMVTTYEINYSVIEQAACVEVP